jgi:hypothetical protein
MSSIAPFIWSAPWGAGTVRTVVAALNYCTVPTVSFAGAGAGPAPAGAVNATTALPDTAPFVALVAVTVTVWPRFPSVGVVYMPVDVMLPRAGEIVQITACPAGVVVA